MATPVSAIMPAVMQDFLQTGMLDIWGGRIAGGCA